MKKVLFALLLICCGAARAQVYNNEWIVYAKTYYKFKVGKNAVHRISQPVLAAAGLSSAPAEQFQLWRNGVQVPLYTSSSSGPLGAAGFLEFWGQMNDGKADRELYRSPEWQLNDKWSLSTDTATYFLTVNANAAENLRLQGAPNSVAGNTLPAEPYFMHTAGQYFHDQINAGYAVNVGEYMYSSSYDKGEGWSTGDITSTASPTGVAYGTHASALNNLYVYNGGPAPSFKIAVSGNTITQRRYKVTVNGDSVIGNQVDFFGYTVDSTVFSLSTIASGNANVSLTNIANITCLPLPTGCQTDRMVIHKYEITYPRQFNFGAESNFEFRLPASATGNFLQITNFSYGSNAPVLYDLTNGKRYVADMSAAPVLQFVLPASASARSFALTSLDPSNVNSITTLQARNFVDYTAPAAQGDYLIITSPVLMNGPGGTNPIDDYKAYRSSVAGGSYNAKTYFADEIIDQFGFGIKKFPGAIRNFLLYARTNYTVKPRYVFLIGKGVQYLNQRQLENNPSAAVQEGLANQNLVPTFGWPASDVLLTADPGSSMPKIPIGRLSVVSPAEVTAYLNKVKEFELAQKQPSSSIGDRAWMKNVVHIVGASDNILGPLLEQLMGDYKKVIEDTLYGGKVSTFTKTSSNPIQQLSTRDLVDLFNQGISIITYFGHSSATTLEYNLDNPENYSNQGKYPLFVGLGCNAGNFYNYNPLRFTQKETISERYVLAPNRGTIGFVASSHFGIVHYLDVWNTRFYRNLSVTQYGKSIGEMMVKTVADVFLFTNEADFYARCNAEENQFHGDPAIVPNPHPKADYVLEDQNVRINPGFISVADASFKVQAKFTNIGRAPGTPIVVEVKRTLPNQSMVVIRRDTIPGIRFTDSISITVPIDPIAHKGLNKITVTVDADNTVDEIYETNNSITKEFMIYEDEARPVYPYNLAIVNKPSVKFIASTANPFSDAKVYRIEVDTTEFFNSPAKLTKDTTAAGGILTFTLNAAFTDSTVYYWRVAPVPASGPFSWNAASFIYLAGSATGFNQSHLFQQFKSSGSRIYLDSASQRWKYGTILQNLFVKHGTWVTSASQAGAFTVSTNGVADIRLTCWFQSLVFNVYDPVSFKRMENVPVTYPSGGDPVGTGLYGSTCPDCFGAYKPWNFEYRYTDSASRRKMMDFMRDTIPDGSYVVVRNFSLDPAVFAGTQVAFASDWLDDTLVYGSGRSLYHSLKAAGLSGIDSFYRTRPWSLIYKKGDPSFTPRWVMGDGIYDNVTLNADCPTSDTIGYISSPKFGPAKAWKQLFWRGESIDPGLGDNPTVNLLGIKANGQVDTLMQDIPLSQPVTDISSIPASQYPYLQLRMTNHDSVYFTPFQLRYWRLTYDPVPEGAVSPNIFFQMKDTVDVAEPLQFRMAFKNVGDVPFPDSIRVKMIVTDRNNVSHVLPTWKQKALAVNDTLNVRYPADTRQLVGHNAMFVEVNPDNDQPEQYHFNNFFYKTFYVRPDTLNPLLDVTFDNVRIMNRDIVSAKPNILIKLKDESKWYLLNDTATVTVQIRYPDNSLHAFHFDGTTMQFVPAQTGGDNTAVVQLKPQFDLDGDYELIVTGKDMSANKAGELQYRVSFRVFNKPMISNMLNYPNPFTTSTAFVFTVTGSEVPQNIRIQVMTVTGKIVREITKEELGPIHVGQNVTEFKWDGTDQYGQKLANGVYLYRVITNLNGASLDKFTDTGDKTDQYFNKGYGKMYLMR